MRFFKRPWSLVARLSAWYAASAFFLVAISTVFLYWSLLKTIDAQSDFLLLEKAQAAAALPDLDSLKRRVEMEWPARQNDRAVVRVLTSDGKTLAQSPKAPSRLFESVAGNLPVLDLGTRAQRGTDVKGEDGAPYRALVARAGDRRIEVALSREGEHEFLAKYRTHLVLVLLSAMVLCALLGHRIAISRITDAFDRLSRFSADIAHELRTPLNNLHFEMEVTLRKTRSVDEYRDTLGSCLEETNRISRIIDSLLFLARAENPSTQVAKERIELKNELEAVREFYDASAQEAGVSLTVDAPADFFLNVEKTLFHRAIANLVGNAISHTPKGGRIEIRAAADTGSVRVTVSDTGSGIARGHLPHLFERFYRVDQARTSDGGRVGLGLAIVKSIATIHGGSVAVDSELGRGTKVCVSFPRA